MNQRVNLPSSLTVFRTQSSPAIGWTVRIVIHGRAVGETIHNSFHYQVTQPDKMKICSAFMAVVMPSIQACLNKAYKTEGIDVRWVNNPWLRFDGDESQARFSGLVAGANLPTQRTVHILLNTTKPSCVGRKPFSPLSLSDQTASLAEELVGNLDAWNMLAKVLSGPLTVDGTIVGIPVILSSKSDAQVIEQ